MRKGTFVTMRVIAGKYRSRPLRSMRGMEIRPTSDRLRETLFDILCARNPEALEGLRFVDLFAGTGAVGIEALSRGAGEVVFVESSPKAAALIEQNLAALGVKSGFRVLRTEALKALRELEGEEFAVDVVFLDPPYAQRDAYSETLSALCDSGALVIAEHEKRFDPGDKFGSLARVRKVEQGDAALSFYRRR